MHVPDANEIKARLRAIVRPRTKLGKTALWFGGLAAILSLVGLVVHSAMLSGWTTFLTWVFIGCELGMGLRWVRQRLMWRLRNRLIVTYVFIGVIPMILLVAMALVAGYLFAGQFATYIALSDMQTELQHLEAANNALAAQFRSLSRSDKLTPQLASEIASASDENFQQRTVTVTDGEKAYVMQPGGKPAETQVRLPEGIKGDFASFTMEGNRLHLRAVKHADMGGRQLVVVSNVPVTPQLLQRTASRVGSVELYLPDQEAEHPATGEVSNQKGQASSGERGKKKAAAQDSVSIDLGGSQSRVQLSGRDVSNASQNIRVGQVAPAANRLDRQFDFWTLFTAMDWRTGKPLTGAMVISTRPSMLYTVLFGTLGEKAGIFVQVLAGIAIFLGIIELVALFIGVRLTRSMTKSVAELYTATQYVNRGELSHRIQVRSHDQMAALEQAFNSMTTSLARLITEQKEKQRLESELAIAHEVQTLLFPRESLDLPRLEVHGVCRPARTVSGDYYDFIPLPEERLVLAVGDISGKGISAALLMATVHAFVRAYSLEPELTAVPVIAAGAGDPQNCDTELFYPRTGPRETDLAPGLLMSTLNYQLFRATPPEKYATLFLGCYDPASQSLIYSNAGHLPPIIMSRDGRVSRLDTSGTVVGLFDGMAYEECRVPMRPGDVFVAFSDGVTEPENEFGEFGEDRLIELIRLHRDQPLPRISEVVTAAVADWIGGAEQPDDVTLVLARAC